MAQEETTPKERKDYILQQREASKKYGHGPSKRVLGDMSFIDRVGNIIRPNKADYQQEQAIKLNQQYDALISKYGKDSKKVQVFERKELGSPYQDRRHGKGIEGTLGIIGLFVGIFFLSPNLTGNAIGNLTNSTTTGIGAVLLVAGLVGSFFWFKGRKK